MFRYPGLLHRALYLRRDNRFVVFVNRGGKEIRCHLPNPGRMTEILIPGETMLLIRYAKRDSARKTKATVVAAICENEIINLDTTIFSKFLIHEIGVNSVPLLSNWKISQSEVTFGNHRFDFVLADPINKIYITEVKSTTRVINGTACFPDAVSKRASSHVSALIELQKQGKNTMLIFLVYRKAVQFRPCSDIDPEFSEYYAKAIKSGIRILILQVNCSIRENSEGTNLFLKIDGPIN